MIKIGVVGVPGGWSSEKLADAICARTGFRLLIDMRRIALDLTSGKAFAGDVDLTRLDGLVVKKIGADYSANLLDRLEILRYLNERGLAVFSSPKSLLRVLDRLSCTVSLKSADIPMPPTVITEDVDVALETLRRFGEAVFKPLYTSKARGMCLIRIDEDAPDRINRFKKDNPVMYIQQKIDLPGNDLGLVFIGGRYLTTYARIQSPGAWNTTTRSGGKYTAYDPPAQVIALAQKAQALFDLAFTCVDVVESDDGPVVFEVSAFGGFRGILTASGIDAADLYADYVVRRICQ